jgi:hypothetical protein
MPARGRARGRGGHSVGRGGGSSGRGAGAAARVRTGAALSSGSEDENSSRSNVSSPATDGDTDSSGSEASETEDSDGAGAAISVVHKRTLRSAPIAGAAGSAVGTPPLALPGEVLARFQKGDSVIHCSTKQLGVVVDVVSQVPAAADCGESGAQYTVRFGAGGDGAIVLCDADDLAATMELDDGGGVVDLDELNAGWEGWGLDGWLEDDDDDEYRPELDPDADAQELADDHVVDLVASVEMFRASEDNELVYLHWDIEVTSSDRDGAIVQLSCVAVMLAPDGSVVKTVEFNKVVKPPGTAEWSAVACSVHGMGRNDFASGGRFENADPIEVVWPAWVAWVEGVLGDGVAASDEPRQGVAVCWGGTACEATWIHRITEQQHPGVCHWPDCVPFFWDPCSSAKSYVSCKLNPKATKSPDTGLGLAAVYVLTQWTPTGPAINRLVGAHDAIEDCRAQAKIVHSSPKFYPFDTATNAAGQLERRTTAVDNNLLKFAFMKGNGAVFVAELNAKKRAKVKAAAAELTKPVAAPWSETDGTPHEFPREYTGPASGPAAAAKDVNTWADLILLTLSWAFLTVIAGWSNAFAMDVGVHEVVVEGKARPRLSRRTATDPAGTVYRSRFKASSRNKWLGITEGSLMVYFGIRLLVAAVGLRSPELLWEDKYGGVYPWARNAMSRPSFRQHSAYVCYSDLQQQPKPGSPNFKRLYPVEYLITHFNKEWPSNWTVGEHVAVDESMILYKGKKIDFVQFMPAKPIKHGIKVYALCCSYTGYCFAYEIFEGKSEGVDNSPEAVVDRLLSHLGFEAEEEAGRTMFTDNWYTSPKLAAHIGTKYNMALIGTFRLTKKKSRDGSDFPYSKFSGPAMKIAPRGFFRRSVAKMFDVVGSGPLNVWLEAVIWKDKRAVGLLSSRSAGAGSDTVQRWSKAQRKYTTVACPFNVVLYKDNMNGVDCLDRDVSDNGIHARSSGGRWWHNIAWWLFSVNHANDFRIATYWPVDAAPDCFKEFVRNVSRRDNRRHFNMAKAMAMVRLGVERDWPDNSEPRPTWMRQRDWVPCGCRSCYFCMVNLTNGVQHKAQQSKKRGARPAKLRCVATTKVVAGDGAPSKCQGCVSRMKLIIGTGKGKPKDRKNTVSVKCTGCKRFMCGLCGSAHIVAADSEAAGGGSSSDMDDNEV